jgi:rubrerythrin
LKFTIKQLPPENLTASANHPLREENFSRRSVNAKDPNSKSEMAIISQAIDLEKEAEKAYADLASSTADQRGHDMFTQLSEEEHRHFRLLTDAYWTLSNFGEWKYVQP